MSLLQIKNYMTVTPYAIHSEATLQEAINVMRKHSIRHLPVIKDGKPFGIITDRDLKALLLYAGTDAKHLHVGDVCSDEPFITSPETSLSDVAEKMAKYKFGSALVVEDGKLLGIFTAVDACSALHEITEKSERPAG